MDETLISAMLNTNPLYYAVNSGNMPENFITDTLTDDASKKPSNKVKVVVRPYAKEVLEYLAANYNLIIFTAGAQDYADPIIDQLDPDGIIFSLRLFRQSCIKRNQFYIKDLRIIRNFDLKDIVLIDNSIISFAFQMDNGIPINAFTGKQNEAGDEELLYMVQFLENIFSAEDVRNPLRENFNMSRMMEDTKNKA
jgi:Dullard-like phosphatase family protein